MIYVKWFLFSSLIYTCSAITNVTVYYDTFCSDCHRFIQHQLYPGFQRIGSNINLEMVPVIKTSYRSNNNWVVQCYHGPQECYINAMDTCVFNNEQATMSQKLYFIGCTKLNIRADSKIMCADTAQIPVQTINDCIESNQGAYYLAKGFQEMEAQQLPFENFPTIIINDVFNQTVSYECEKKFVKTVCKYIGAPKPQSCL